MKTSRTDRFFLLMNISEFTPLQESGQVKGLRISHVIRFSPIIYDMKRTIEAYDLKIQVTVWE
jgi:hypothetical protein